MEYFKNDNSLKQLGIEYQKLVALESCLNAKANERIWIECRGDIATTTISTEVKHHTERHQITSNSEDVWKTLKNYVENESATLDFEKLILHTTSSISQNSIFNDWDTISTKEKIRRLVDHQPSKTVEPFHTSIKNHPTDSLSVIIDKFYINAHQESIIDKWQSLQSHGALGIIPNEYKDEALTNLIGWITRAFIVQQKNWQIEINDFHRDLRFSLSKYTQEKIPFPNIKASEVSPSEDLEYTFTKKLLHIDIDPECLEEAVSDYLRANLSLAKLIGDNPEITDTLEEYDSDVKREITQDKRQITNNIPLSDEQEELKHSRNLYFSCTSKPHEQIPKISDTRKYYRNGRIHYTAESSDFHWRIRKIQS